MRLELEDIIGFGGYGKVYIGCVTSHPTTSTVVAVKRSRWAWKITNPMLRHEACALLMLRGHPNIPVVYAWDRSQGFEYLVMERLGRDLASSLASTGGLTMPNLVALTCQMLDAIQHVHAHHIVHCDIKPHNFLFDLNPASGLIKLIDFGFARVYRDSSTLEHVGESTMRHLIGTKAYASLNVHLHHHNPSRRDDLESLAYTVVKLLCGALPWRDLRSADTCAAKQKWFGSALCAGYPPVFGQFVDYVRALGFREAPGYNGWIRRFMAVAPQLRGHPLYDASDHGPRVGQRLGQGDPPAVTVLQKPDSFRITELLSDPADDFWANSPGLSLSQSRPRISLGTSSRRCAAIWIQSRSPRGVTSRGKLCSAIHCTRSGFLG